MVVNAYVVKFASSGSEFQVVDAVQAVKATSERGDIRYPIKVSQLILIDLVFICIPIRQYNFSACDLLVYCNYSVVVVDMIIFGVSLCK